MMQSRIRIEKPSQIIRQLLRWAVTFYLIWCGTSTGRSGPGPNGPGPPFPLCDPLHDPHPGSCRMTDRGRTSDKPKRPNEKTCPDRARRGCAAAGIMVECGHDLQGSRHHPPLTGRRPPMRDRFDRTLSVVGLLSFISSWWMSAG